MAGPVKLRNDVLHKALTPHERCPSPGVPHGFRSSFRDWAAEQTAFPRAVMEAAHKVADEVETAYFRSDLLEKRRELVQQWTDYLSSG